MTLKTLKHSIAKLSLGCAIAIGCTGAATTTALMGEIHEPQIAYADGWTHFFSPETDGWVWLYKSGSGYLHDWQYINGSWYRFADHGPAYMLAGWLDEGKYPNHIWYYLGTDGAMKTGWQSIGGKWYYFNKSGVMQTGWQSIGGKWYYFDGNGAMQTGWVKSNYNIWYYCDKSGAMVTGWNKVGSTWYYHNKSGEMQIGWQRINGKWYHFNMSGAMSANKWVGNYYCKSDGSMATNEKIGKYYVGADGLWVGASEESKSLHVKTNAYEFDIPADWKDKVTWSTSGDQTTVSLLDDNGNDVGLLFSVNVSRTYYGGGNTMSPVIYRQHYSSSSNTDPSKYKVLEVTVYNSIATVDALSNYDVDKMSALIEFQTGGAATLKKHLNNPSAYPSELVNNYMSSKLLPTLVLKN